MRSIGEKLERQKRLARASVGGATTATSSSSSPAASPLSSPTTKQTSPMSSSSSSSPTTYYRNSASRSFSSPSSSSSSNCFTALLKRVRKTNIYMLLVIVFVFGILVPVLLVSHVSSLHSRSHHHHHHHPHADTNDAGENGDEGGAIIPTSSPSFFSRWGIDFFRFSTLFGGDGGNNNNNDVDSAYRDENDGDDDDEETDEKSSSSSYYPLPLSDRSLYKKDAVTVIVAVRRVMPTQRFFQALLQIEMNHRGVSSSGSHKGDDDHDDDGASSPHHSLLSSSCSSASSVEFVFVVDDDDDDDDSYGNDSSSTQQQQGAFNRATIMSRISEAKKSLLSSSSSSAASSSSFSVLVKKNYALLETCCRVVHLHGSSRASRQRFTNNHGAASSSSSSTARGAAEAELDAKQKMWQQQQRYINRGKGNKKTSINKKASLTALGHFYSKGAKAARAESKYLLFLSGFVQILEPRSFITNLVRDITLHNHQEEETRKEGKTRRRQNNVDCTPTDVISTSSLDGDDDDDGDDVDSSNAAENNNDDVTTITNAAAFDSKKKGQRQTTAEEKEKKKQPRQKQRCRYGAIQCLLLEESTAVDARRSSSHIIVDAGWTVDIGTSSTSPTKFVDETVFLANREAGVPERASRFFHRRPRHRHRHHHQQQYRHLPHTVDGIDPSCMFVNRADFEDAAGFERQARVPTVVDALMNNDTFTMIERRESTLSQVFESIIAVETIVEQMTMDEVRRATPRLRKQVRTSYSAVTDAVTLFETLANRGIATERAKLRRTSDQKREEEELRKQQAQMLDGSSASSKKKKKRLMMKKSPGEGGALPAPDDYYHRLLEDDCLRRDRSTEDKLACATDRLIVAGTAAKNMANYVVPTVPEKLLGWLLSLRMRVMIPTSSSSQNGDETSTTSDDDDDDNDEEDMEIVVGVSTSARVTLDFDAIGNAAVSKAISSRYTIASFMVHSVPELEPWLPFLRSRHHSYKGVTLSAPEVDDVNKRRELRRRYRHLHNHQHRHRHSSLPSSSSSPVYQQKQKQKQKQKQDEHTTATTRKKQLLLTVVRKSVKPPRVIDLKQQQHPQQGSSTSSFLRVVWFAICCGCCGFSAEMAHYARALSELHPVSFIPGPQCFCPGLPAGFSDMLVRQNIKINQYTREELSPGGETLIWISHTDPPSFVQGGFFVRRKPSYLIGRTMYEFSRLPPKWEEHVTEADELWVPSLYARDVFLRCGKGLDPERVLIVPEGIDTSFYSPEAHRSRTSSLRFVRDSAVDDHELPWTNIFCNRDSFWASSSGQHNNRKRRRTRGSGDDNDNENMKKSYDYHHHSSPHYFSTKSEQDALDTAQRHSNKKWSRPQNCTATGYDPVSSHFFLESQRRGQRRNNSAAASHNTNDNNDNHNHHNHHHHHQDGDGDADDFLDASTTPRPFQFFSNFKWEPRKGWEFLFDAYFKAFYENQATEDVTLVVLSYVYYAHGTPKEWSVFNESYMMDELEREMHKRFPGKKMHELPRFCIVAESVSEFELAQMFRGADAFVLPTRGEGWGLPTQQAMSMGLPVISTNFGGSVDFTTPDTAFLIEIDGVNEIDEDSMYTWREGKKWATPSVSHLAELMRYVFTEREHAAEVGERAREHIVKHFDDYEVVKILNRRLEQIREVLK